MSGIRTSSVGSWPIPFGQRPQLKRYYAGELSDAEAHDCLAAAARIAMDEQLACGLDQITGGEVFAPDFAHHIAPRLSGVKAVQLRDTSKGYQGVAHYEVTDAVRAPSGTGHALAFAREKALEPGLGKAAIPSPLTATISFPPGSGAQEQLQDFAQIIEAEVLRMVELGVDEVQLDAPNEAIAMAQARNSAGELAEWLRFPFRAVPSSLRRSIHFCLGDISRKPATEIQNLRSLIPLVQELEGDIDRAHFEASYAGQWEDVALLSEVPDSIEVIAGIADVKRPPDPVPELRAKIDRLLEVIPENRLLVASSCGCGRVPHDEAIRLTRNLVKAASG